MAQSSRTRRSGSTADVLWEAGIRALVEDVLDGAAERAQTLATPVRVGGRRLPAKAAVHTGASGEPTLVVVVVGEVGRLPAEALVQERFGLTPRESEVALLLAQRRSNKEIARALRVTIHTAERHTEKVLGKLGLCTRKDVLAALTKAA